MRTDRQTDRHINKEKTYSFIEAFEVNAILCLGKFVTVILTLNLEFFTHGLSSQVTIARYVDDWDLYTYRYTQMHIDTRPHLTM